MVSNLIHHITLAGTALLGSTSAAALLPRQNDPSIPTQWTPLAPTDAIPSDFNLTFSSTIASKAGWPSLRFFTNTIEWMLDQTALDFNQEIGAVSLWESGSSFNLKAYPAATSGSTTFPRRVLLWGLYRGLEYRLSNDEWRPGNFSLMVDGKAEAVLEFVDNPNANALSGHNTNGTDEEFDATPFQTGATWLSKAVIQDQDFFLPIARMALSAAIFGQDSVVASPGGWEHIIDVPQAASSKKPQSKVQINVFEPPKADGALALQWGWVVSLLRAAVHAERLRNYASNLEVKLAQTGDDRDVVGTLRIVELSGVAGNSANGTAVVPTSGARNGTAIEPIEPPAESESLPVAA